METARCRFRAFLEWKGWSHHDAAKELGFSQPTISGLLAGRAGPGLSLAHKIEGATTEWPGGPIRTEEWDPKLAPAEGGEAA